MAAKFDESEFIDADYESSRQALGITSSTANSAVNPIANRPPSREDIETKVSDAHSKLAELKRAQEQLERERAALEEARRRRIEFSTGREEMLTHLTRGVQLLEEGEFAARRDAEQMSKSLTDMREALEKVTTLNEESWTQENWSQELTRALTVLENARMEWNSARLKWPVLDGALRSPEEEEKAAKPASILEGKTTWELCYYGLVLTWPVALAALIGSIAIAVILLSR